jgi:hypothetical protein
MKTHLLLPLFAAAFLSSCSPSYIYPTKNITVILKNGAEKEYGLLSVRGDSAIVVIDWEERSVKPFPFSHAETLKKDLIQQILRKPKGIQTKYTYLTAIAGAVVGGVIASVSQEHLAHSNSPVIDTLVNPIIRTANVFTWAAYILIGTAIGAVPGLILDGFATPNMSLSLSNDQDQEFLRAISAYPAKEPNEMKYIK